MLWSDDWTRPQSAYWMELIANIETFIGRDLTFTDEQRAPFVQPCNV